MKDTLIAAAPELLEACKQAEAELRAMKKLLSVVTSITNIRFDGDKVLEELRNAIAKAEGREPNGN